MHFLLLIFNDNKSSVTFFLLLVFSVYSNNESKKIHYCLAAKRGMKRAIILFYEFFQNKTVASECICVHTEIFLLSFCTHPENLENWGSRSGENPSHHITSYIVHRNMIEIYLSFHHTTFLWLHFSPSPYPKKQLKYNLSEYTAFCSFTQS